MLDARREHLTLLLANQQSQADHDAALLDYANSIDRRRQAQKDAGSDSDADLPDILPDPGPNPPPVEDYLDDMATLFDSHFPLLLLVESRMIGGEETSHMPSHLVGVGSRIRKEYE